MIWEIVIEALLTLRSNKLRTVLTMIGIILGVAAVIAIMTLGQSVYVTAEEEITDSGYGNIKITVNNTTNSPLPLNKAVIDVLIMANIPQVSAYDPQFNGAGGTVYSMDDNSLEMFNTYNDVRSINKLVFLAGHPFTEDDITEKSQVVIISDYTAQKLYGSAQAALNQSIRLDDGSFYHVIGVAKNESMFTPTYGRLYIPKSLGELSLNFQTNGYGYIDVNLKPGADYEKIASEIEQILIDTYGFANKEEMAFKVENVKDIVAEISTFMTVFSIGLALIAAISLVVGGVGIMNIMLVNVTERTKEIGLMKALGAQEKDITFQFLVEAIVMTICGGIIGVLIGTGGSFLVIWLVNTFAGNFGNFPHFKFVISYASIAVSLVVSTAIGLIFGSYPAKRAAKLDPVEALRRD
jgi:putative ABC transport system permease protein